MKHQTFAVAKFARSIATLAISLFIGIFAENYASAVDWDPDDNPLTVGPDNEFMVGVYHIWTNSDMAGAASRGFNVVHSYSFRNQSGTQNPSYLTPNQFISQAASHGLSVMMQLGVLVPSEPDVPLPTSEDVQELAVHDNIAMWSIVPEEISWYPPGPSNTNFAQLKQWADAVHANDPQERPVTHYLASNFAEVDLAPYTPFIDGIGAGAYADHGSKPRPWIRWRIEQEVNAIRNTGSREGVFPIAVLQMFASEGNPGETNMQAQDGYHDAYLSLVSGAKAVMIFTGGRKNEIPGLYDRYGDFAKEINGADRYGDVFLKGIDLGELAHVKPIVQSGPAKSEAFTTSFAWPPSGPTVQYDSISYRVMAHNEQLYLAAVNSAEQAVSASFPSVRAAGPIDVLFQNRQVSAANEQFTDSFTALGANNYRLPVGSSLVVAQDTFSGPDGPAAGWSPAYGNGSVVNSAGVTTVHRGTASTEYLLRNISSQDLPVGAYLELQVKADADTAFYLELVDSQSDSAALINWQRGTGEWQTLRAEFSGSWQATNSLWLGIRGGASYEVGQLGIYYAAPDKESWNQNGGGSWHDSKLWLAEAVPNSNSAAVKLGGAITTDATIFTDTNVQIRTIEFDNANRYAIAGQGTVTFASTSGPSDLQVVQGAHEFQARVALASNLSAVIAAGTQLAFNGQVDLNGHDIVVTGGGVLSINNRVEADGGNIIIDEGGGVGGSGSIDGDVLNAGGLLSPGNSPGTLAISGNYTQSSVGKLRMEIGGLEGGIGHDQLIVDGLASLAGSLEIVLLPSFEPARGNSFKLFDLTSHVGEFQAIALPTLAHGLMWDSSQLYTRGELSVAAVPEPTSATTLFVLLSIGAIHRTRLAGQVSFRRLQQ